MARSPGAVLDALDDLANAQISGTTTRGMHLISFIDQAMNVAGKIMQHSVDSPAWGEISSLNAPRVLPGRPLCELPAPKHLLDGSFFSYHPTWNCTSYAIGPVTPFMCFDMFRQSYYQVCVSGYFDKFIALDVLMFLYATERGVDRAPASATCKEQAAESSTATPSSSSHAAGKAVVRDSHAPATLDDIVLSAFEHCVKKTPPPKKIEILEIQAEAIKLAGSESLWSPKVVLASAAKLAKIMANRHVSTSETYRPPSTPVLYVAAAGKDRGGNAPRAALELGTNGIAVLLKKIQDHPSR